MCKPNQNKNQTLVGSKVSHRHTSPKRCFSRLVLSCCIADPSLFVQWCAQSFFLEVTTTMWTGKGKGITAQGTTQRNHGASLHHHLWVGVPYASLSLRGGASVRWCCRSPPLCFSLLLPFGVVLLSSLPLLVLLVALSPCGGAACSPPPLEWCSSAFSSPSNLGGAALFECR